jgi:poly(A) polymerase
MTNERMGAIGKLAPQPWMKAAETRTLFKALKAEGNEARFIGGCVRNAIVGLPVEDIDIATTETPHRVLKLLEAANIKAIPTGIEHGTVTAVINSIHYEITSLRIDVENHGRRATVAYTDDWVADALRRDFTINTMSSTIEGDIFDPLSGMDDLNKRRVRFVGSPKLRIEEDLLRLLRFFRFHATFGGNAVDQAAITACRRLAPRLNELSAERVQSELFKILEAPNPANTMILMNNELVLKYVLPEAKNFSRLKSMDWLETNFINIDTINPDKLRRLAALLFIDEAGHAALAKRLRLSNKQCSRLAIMTKFARTPVMELSQLRRHHALYDLGADNFRDLVLLNWSQEKTIERQNFPERTKHWLDLIDAADTWQQPIFPIKGGDAKKLGLKQGPAVGRALGEVKSWWRHGDFQANRRQCIYQLKQIIKSQKRQ